MSQSVCASAYLAIDSLDRPSSEPVNNFHVGNWNITEIDSITPVTTRFAGLIPNVNQYNNSFAVSTALTSYQVTIPVGLYSTFASFASAVNSAISASGIPNAPEVSYTLVTGTDLALATLTPTVPTAVYISRISPATSLLTGLILESAPSVGVRDMNYSKLTYTPYFDICCSELHKSNKGDETSAKSSSAIIFRVHFNQLTMEIDPHFIADQSNSGGGKKLLFTPYDRSVGNLNLSLVDKFGNLLAVADGFQYDLILAAEYYRKVGKGLVGQ